MKLLVISHVDVVGENRLSTRNRSLNLILNEYAKHFDEVGYFGPRRNSPDGPEKLDIRMWHTNTYDRSASRRLGFVFSRAVCEEIDSVLKEFRPDVIQLRVPSIFATKIGLHVKSNHKDKIFCYVAGDAEESLRSNYHFPGAGLIAKAAVHWEDRLISGLPVVCAGDVLKQKLQHRHGDKLSTYAYYSTTHNSICRSENRSNVILAVGRLEPLKRPELALETLAVLNRLSDTRFILKFMGEGVDRIRLEAIADALGVSEQVIFHGYENDSATLKGIFLDAKYLLQMSSSEGTSKVLVEAMAHGVVPVAIRGVGSNDYILAEGRGSLTDPIPDQVAQAVNSIDNKQERYRSMQEAGYAYARKHTLTKEVQKMFGWIKERNALHE